jgi:hypothetical protein
MGNLLLIFPVVRKIDGESPSVYVLAPIPKRW